MVHFHAIGEAMAAKKEINTLEALGILHHVIMEKFWNVIETETPIGFTSQQQKRLSDALHEGMLLCVRTLEKEGPNAFHKLKGLSTAR